MSVIEQSELAPQETASAVIFLPEDTGVGPVEKLGPPLPDIYTFSSNFWMRTHMDYPLFENNFGSVLSVGQNAENQLVDIDSPDKTQNLGLTFDARERDQGRYLWQVSKSNNSGRTIDQLQVSYSGYRKPPVLHGTRYKLDQQGALRGEEDLNEIETNLLAETIRELAEHPEVTSKIEKYRVRKEIATRELGAYSVEWTRRHEPRRYKEEIARRERMIKSIGFAALPPYKPPKKFKK